MSRNISKAERDEANYQYFVSLANSRASLTNLPMMALLTAVLLGLDLIPIGSLIFFGERHTDLLPLFYWHLVVIGFSLLMSVLFLFQRLVFRYQVVSSSFTVFFAAVGWVYACAFMALGIGSMVEDPRAVGGGVMVSGERLFFLSLIGSLYILGATVIHVLLVRKRLDVGHSDRRRMGNYLAASNVYRSKSIWIFFTVALIGPTILTGGQYLLATIGTLLFLLFASVLTGLPVEFGYLTYLKSRDQRYWEEPPPTVVVTRTQKISIWKKAGRWALFVIAAFTVIAVLNEILPRIL